MASERELSAEIVIASEINWTNTFKRSCSEEGSIRLHLRTAQGREAPCLGQSATVSIANKGRIYKGVSGRNLHVPFQLYAYHQLPMRSLRKNIREKLNDMAIELIQVIGFNVILFIGYWLSRWMFGQVMLIGRYPMDWLFDVGHAALVICFSTRSCLLMFDKL